MSTIDDVMQAAERLRRLVAEDPIDIYGLRDRYGGKTTHEGLCRMAGDFLIADRRTLADFAMSILPKGKRPAAMETPKHGQTAWTIFCEQVQEGRVEVRDNMPYVEVEGVARFLWLDTTQQPVFATEAEANLEMVHRSLENHVEVAAAFAS